MKMNNLRDAIITSVLKDGLRSRAEIEANLGLQKSLARKSLIFLKESGLIYMQMINENEFYSITESGVRTVDRILS